MTTVHDDRPAAPAAPEPSGDPLARVGRQLVEAERRLRWRRARRRVAGGTAAGGLLVLALVVALLPGGPLGGPLGADGPGAAGGRGPAGTGDPLAVRGQVRVSFTVAWGGSADEVVLDRVRARLAAASYPDADVRADGGRVAAGLSWVSGRGTHANQRAQIRALLGTGQLAVYDFEGSVVDREGRPIASRPPASLLRVSQAGGTAGAGMTLAQARAAAARVPGPTEVVRALAGGGGRQSPRVTDPRTRYYVLRGTPALTGTDVSDVRAVEREGGQPAVRLDLRPQARDRFHAMSREVAQRGQSLLRPARASAAVAQHFALVLDGHILAVAAVDPQRLPDGISGDRGVLVEGGFTPARARAFAAGLDAGGGPLPPLRALRIDER